MLSRFAARAYQIDRRARRTEGACGWNCPARWCKAKISRPEARDQVAEVLVKLGVRPERGNGPITETDHSHLVRKSG